LFRNCRKPTTHIFNQIKMDPNQSKPYTKRNNALDELVKKADEERKKVNDREKVAAEKAKANKYLGRQGGNHQPPPSGSAMW
jgi:hypothetical protein